MEQGIFTTPLTPLPVSPYEQEPNFCFEPWEEYQP